MKTIREWAMAQELEKIIDELPDEAQVFIQTLIEHLDPHSPFLEQQSERQSKFLYGLYERHCNEDEEAAQEYLEEL